MVVVVVINDNDVAVIKLIVERQAYTHSLFN